MKAHWQMRASAVAMAAFVASMAAITVDKGSLAIALMALSGFSVGYVELLALVLVPFTCPPGDIGLASGFQSCCRGTMGTIATAIYATVLENRNLVNIPGQVGPAALRAGLPAGSVAMAVKAAEAGTPAALAKVPGMTPAIRDAIQMATRVANAMSFRTMFLVSIAFGVTSAASSFFIRNLDRHLTDDVARKLQGVKSRPVRADIEQTKEVA
ncbi:uncharacterized protein E0L32_007457 [Thyridium curvatum]|uniref:Uncharacterized protein n=1 Tax=Thyridium curvatum TaxID=1093900 RepID=A0A507B541_9PEZI|nr:uncharacterized protein E0L32_007457 [Thyridium curvatum]TPX11720.1 hypothetical protein E0L32_007457 [Thyridium curvatum]